MNAVKIERSTPKIINGVSIFLMKNELMPKRMSVEGAKRKANRRKMRHRKTIDTYIFWATPNNREANHVAMRVCVCGQGTENGKYP